MSREKFVFNPTTLQYEKHTLSPAEKFKRIIVLSISVLLISGGIVYMMYLFFPTPREMALKAENTQMTYYVQKLKNEFDVVSSDLERLQLKDANVHRMIFGIDPMDKSIWEGGIGGHKKYKMVEDIGDTGELIAKTLEEVDGIKRKIKLQKESLQMLYQKAKEKEKKLASIPSIKPVVQDKLKRDIKYLSGFGVRLHPVHKVKKFHKGIDFTAPKGTAIQATGNGKVVRVENRKNGYGKNVIIDHGYGYSSLYAHMNVIDVKEGDIVRKGQKIGEIGSTGTSTGAHLHYEVRINGKAVNPVDYVLDGLTAKEYKELVLNAQVMNQSFD